jgi:hypothetical protein
MAGTEAHPTIKDMQRLGLVYAALSKGSALLRD